MFCYTVLLIFFILLVKHLFKSRCSSCEFHWDIWSGYSIWKEYFLNKLWLKLTQAAEGLSPTRYDHKKRCETLEDLGILPHKSDEYLEEPRDISKESSQVIDEICFMGMSKDGHFVAKIGRRNGTFSEIWLIFILSDGTIFELPFHPDSRAQCAKDDAFECQGLKLTCLSAMRKWRITFNGILRSRKQDKVLHVKFALKWTAMFNPMDNKNIKNSTTLSRLFAQIGWKRTPSDCKSLESYFGGYEQWGMITGTVNIEGKGEQKMLYWGPKLRKTGEAEAKNFHGSNRMYGYMEDGKYFQLTKRKIYDTKSVNYGYMGLPSLEHYDVNWNFLPKHTTLDQFQHSKIHIRRGNQCENLKVQEKTFEIELYSEESSLVRLRVLELHMKGESGWAFEVSYEPNSIRLPDLEMKIHLKPTDEKYGPILLSLTDPLCRSSYLAGGKGSSLSLLKTLSTKNRTFSVPDGFVITTLAYQTHLSANKELRDSISTLEQVVWKKIEGSIEEACDRVVMQFQRSTCDYELKGYTEKFLCMVAEGINIFALFAVRSSAVGEDGEELSSAGQNDTFLGVAYSPELGTNELMSAVKNCWASQFKLPAVQYKKQNGQIFNPGMAVVVQKMVAAEVAGVMFTQHPITGNPDLISITANYGLGESVVSATAEPDTYVWSKAKEQTMESEIGEKKLQIRLNDQGGVEELTPDDSVRSVSCLSDEQITSLAKLGKEVEEAFGNPRDIEWALLQGHTYLLQSRPVTSLDKESEYELTHEQDSAIATKYEVLTRANVGEVSPGAQTPLSISLTAKLLDVATQVSIKSTISHIPNFEVAPEVGLTVKFSHSQLVLAVLNITHITNPKGDGFKMSRPLELSIYGRYLDNEEYRKRGIQRYGIAPQKGTARFFVKMFLTVLRMRDNFKKLDSLYQKLDIKPENYDSANLLYQEIASKVGFIYKTSFIHGDCSSYNTMMNVIVISLMAGDKEWPEHLISDYAGLLGSCGDLISASVPHMIGKLAETISKVRSWEQFASLDPTDANKWLLEDQSEAGTEFREFLKCHGHRCIKEFDLYSVPWEMDSVDLVRAIQAMKAGGRLENSPERCVDETQDILKDVKTPLSNGSKRALRFLIPKLKTSVRWREESKSLLIRSIHVFKKAFRRLGKLMVWEGRIPEDDIVFFLTIGELGKLLETRSPRLVSKAIRRKKLHPKLDALQMEEFMEGLPKPVADDDEIQFNGDRSGVSVRGTPMCQGKIKSTARVVIKLQDATSIQQGDILITKATDIGWTPYFPLLNGIVTELGGIISHGAVVAREYGLPCLIGAKGATKMFKSGDQVILDSEKGTLTKVD